MPRRTKPLRASNLSRLYDRGYFYGETSGYSPKGYPADHPDWALWLDLIGAIIPGGLLLDVGCAYGFLIEEAKQRNYRAIGLDVSPYALSQAPSAGCALVLADARDIPLGDHSADVITLFDVIEHLPNPGACLDESARLLKPEGLLVLTTPDPLFFHRSESTHFCERPPSYWIRMLSDRGFQVQFRFSEVPFNFQLLACRENSSIESSIRRFQHDYFSPAPDMVCARSITALPRWGWGPLQDGQRDVAENGAMIYLLNEEEVPKSARIRFRVRTTGRFSTLRLRFDDWVLRDLHLDSEERDRLVEIDDVLIPSGGHHLYFDLFPGAPRTAISELEIETRPAAPAELTTRLPFDIYQRYERAAHVGRLLRPSSLLDVGGCIGESTGHLATSYDFFAEGTSERVMSSDFRQCDHPDHLPCDALDHPLSDHAFDMVVSMDVLEHIQPDQRKAFLGELDRLAHRWILVGAPFRSPEVQQAEQALSSVLMKDHRFLSEHRDLGLPDAELVVRFARSRDYRLWQLANARLENWLALQSLNHLVFSMRDARSSWELNRLYSRDLFGRDHGLPCYRYFFLLYKGDSSLDPGVVRELDLLQSNLAADPSPGPALTAHAGFQALVHRIESLNETREGTLSAVQFLANARDDHIALLMRERDELIRRLRETPLHVLARQRWRERRMRGKEDEQP